MIPFHSPVPMMQGQPQMMGQGQGQPQMMSYPQPMMAQQPQQYVLQQPPTLIITEEMRLEAFHQATMKHEISEYFASKLRQLEDFKIVCLLDDSGSMQHAVKGPSSVYGVRQTRWTELRSTVSMIIDIASLLDRSGGIDCFFMNRPPIFNVTPWSLGGLEASFSVLPTGYTPTTRCLRQIIQQNAQVIKERRLLILLATDGVPSNDKGREDKSGLKNFLVNERQPAERIPMTILACTDEDDVMSYLNSLDKKAPFLDVVDDYQSERRNILRVQGKSFKFSRGDWICKALLASVDKDMDLLDEGAASCCPIS